MTKEEHIIKQKFGSEVLFKVPEGYFENFTHILMDKLPTQIVHIKPARVVAYSKFRFVTMVAASTITAVLTISTLFNRPSNMVNSQSFSSLTEYIQADTYVDEMADYTMMDSEDMYDYIAYN